MNPAAIAVTLLAPDRPCPPGLRAWNRSDPSVRLAIHRNNVTVSLIDALADAYPVTQELVGADFFRTLALHFVRSHPPTDAVMVHYGERLADFIDAYEAAAGVPYLGDVARLERARVRAFHAADADPLTAEAAQAALACGDRVGELVLELHPSLAVLASRHAAVSIWAAHQGHGDLADVDVDCGESALVVRSDLTVLVLPLAPGAPAFVNALMQRASLADAQAAGAAEATDFDLGAALALLMQHGAVVSIRLPRSASA